MVARPGPPEASRFVSAAVTWGHAAKSKPQTSVKKGGASAVPAVGRATAASSYRGSTSFGIPGTERKRARCSVHCFKKGLRPHTVSAVLPSSASFVSTTNLAVFPQLGLPNGGSYLAALKGQSLCHTCPSALLCVALRCSAFFALRRVRSLRIHCSFCSSFFRA